jgi:peptidoglycan biosynthesis protein MviN/MurJ (putative lipid II flippase)
VEAEAETKPSRWRGRSAVRSGLLTGLSYLTLSGAGALAGVYLAHKFGRNTETDGFMAAYGVYLVLVLGAQAFRMVVVPDLTRAEAQGRLTAEYRAYAFAFIVVAVPVTAVVAAFPGFFGELVTGRLPEQSADIAGRALAWLVPAAFLHLLAALSASALAARDRYGAAAAGYALGGVTSLVFFVLAADSHGLIALAWGLLLAGAVTLALPLLALAIGGGRVRHLRDGGPLEVKRRLSRLVVGVAVPLAVQGLYVIALRFAAGTGEGNVTSLSYAYLLAAMFVSATAFSLSLISAAPLTRRGTDPAAAAEHVVHAAWISLAIVGAASGIVAVVGGRFITWALGADYAGHVGDELGRLVVYLAPWMVGSAAFSIVYPLLFVMHRTRGLVPLALAAVLVDIPISIAGRAWGGLPGVAVALGVSTLLLVFGLMAALGPRVLIPAAVGLARLSLVVLAAAAIAFGGASLLLAAIPAALLGLVVYTGILVVTRELGLLDAWHYVRALH